MMPIAADLFCGLGGWTEGLAAEGWHCRGYDIEAHEYGDEKYPGEFVLRDILQMHGSEIADVDLIVSSSPCQAYSYMAMPWSIAKAKAAAIRADETGQMLRDLNALFDAQFRIQREASEAAGRYIPMVVENVRGAQPWVGRARGNYGSFYLWGDVPALMPTPMGRVAQKFNPDGTEHGTGSWFAIADSKDRGASGRKNADAGGGSWFAIGAPGQTSVNGNPDGRKNPGFRFDGSGKSFQTESVGRHADGVKGSEGYDREHPAAFGWKKPGTSSKSSARKAASAKIAKIPFNLSRHIGMIYHPDYS